MPSKAPGPGSYPIPDRQHAGIAKGLAKKNAGSTVRAAVDRKASAKLGGHAGAVKRMLRGRNNVAAFTAIALAGLALSAYGSVKNAEAQDTAGSANKAAADSQADVADFNASVADEQAQDAIERGTVQEDQFRTQVKGAIGTQRATQAGNNVDVSFGSSVDTQADAAFLGELDALTIRNNAMREAYGYQVTATNYRNSAAIARQTGVYAQAAGDTAATSSLISGGTRRCSRAARESPADPIRIPTCGSVSKCRR